MRQKREIRDKLYFIIKKGEKVVTVKVQSKLLKLKKSRNMFRVYANNMVGRVAGYRHIYYLA